MIPHVKMILNSHTELFGLPVIYFIMLRIERQTCLRNNYGNDDVNYGNTNL